MNTIITIVTILVLLLIVRLGRVVNRAWRPQRVIHETKETPLRVVMRGCMALVGLVFILLISGWLLWLMLTY